MKRTRIVIAGVLLLAAIPLVAWWLSRDRIAPTSALRSAWRPPPAEAPRAAVTTAATSRGPRPDAGAAIPSRALSTAPLISSAANRALASIADALAEKDARRRNQLISVALEKWASEDVEAAGAWSLAPTGLPRNVALAAVIRGGVGVHPLATARYVGRLSVECPDEADELGHDLIFALGKNGLWSAAAAWAAGGKQVNPEWISDAYARWSVAQPAEAQASAAALESPPAREAAQSAIVPANPRSS